MKPFCVISFDKQKEAQDLADTLGVSLQLATIHQFPDRELKVAVPVDIPQTVVLYLSLYDPNEKLIELFLASEVLHQNGVKNIILVAPYLCYMRQDKAFHAGEAVSQTIIAKLLQQYIDGLITVDPHLHRVASLDQVYQNIPVRCLTAMPLFAEYLSNTDAGIIVGPDEESEQWVKTLSELTDRPYVVGHKTRSGDRKVSIRLDVNSQQYTSAFIVDDIVSTGHTAVELATHLKNSGVGNIELLVTHCFSDVDSVDLLEQAGIQKIVATDSIPNLYAELELAPMLAASVRELL
jgi:ribose-phosphate pyrophosphokinase